MRPRGEVRLALASAAAALAAERAAGLQEPLQTIDGRQVAGAWWREIAARGQVGYAVARVTIRDMIRAGELVAQGQTRVPTARRPAAVLVPCAANAERFDPVQPLGQVLQAWVRH